MLAVVALFAMILIVPPAFVMWCALSQLVRSVREALSSRREHARRRFVSSLRSALAA